MFNGNQMADHGKKGLTKVAQQNKGYLFLDRVYFSTFCFTTKVKDLMTFQNNFTSKQRITIK